MHYLNRRFGPIALVVSVFLSRMLILQSGSARDIQAQEYSATVNGAHGAVDVGGTLFMPRSAKEARAVIVVLTWGIGTFVYQDPAWRKLADDLKCGLLSLTLANRGPEVSHRPVGEQAVRNAAIGGAEGLLTLLKRLAEQSGHRELQDTKILLWGHSAAGSFAITFAGLYPTRTVAFVRYHSHSRGLPVDMNAVAHVPGLLFAGEKDTTAGVEDTELLWKRGRAAGAPWTFVIEPGTPHGAPEALKKANELAIPWIRVVFHQRIVGDGHNLRPITQNSGWIADNQTLEVVPFVSFRGVKPEASWLPDDTSARAWRVLSGLGNKQ